MSASASRRLGASSAAIKRLPGSNMTSLSHGASPGTTRTGRHVHRAGGAREARRRRRRLPRVRTGGGGGGGGGGFGFGFGFGCGCGFGARLSDLGSRLSALGARRSALGARLSAAASA